MLVTIFCEIDDFCESLVKENQLSELSTKGRKAILQWSEIVTILVFYHYSGFKKIQILLK
jgi:hypothetical protein